MEGYELEGWEGVLGGDVPQGAGLSSSAVIELATARAFASVSKLDWAPAGMAQFGKVTYLMKATPVCEMILK